MSHVKDLQPDPLMHTFCRPRKYCVGHAWSYTAQIQNDTGIAADLIVFANDGSLLFSGRVAGSIARTTLSILSEEKRVQSVEKPERQMVMDLTRKARSELEKRLRVILD